MKRKMVALMLSAMMAVSLMTGCSGGSDSSASTGSTDTTAAAESAGTDGSAGAADGKTYTIGISQFAEHGSLDNCREGFLAGLADNGIVEGENLTVV